MGERMGWTAVSFYTADTGYEREVERLLASAEAFGVPLVAYAVPNRGSWRLNLNDKSAVILHALDEWPDRDIVFLDADAVIRSYPRLFDELSESRAHDLAACFFEESRLERGELLSGTLWVANTAAGRGIVERWDRYARKHPEIRHQKALAVVLGAGRPGEPGERIYRLPRAYTRIFDHPGMRGVEPVIEHFQASRRLRHNLRSTRPARSPFTGRVA
jgi:hypothetical protein